MQRSCTKNSFSPIKKAAENSEMSPTSELVAGLVDSLNEKQREAVTASASGRLQIIAGPGTGKTKVLISRVAYLILEEGISPHRIIVTTFTKKAANEMMERLETLLKGSGVDLSKLLIGTFHSICFKIIKIYGKKIGIADYGIADEKDSTQILREVISDTEDAIDGFSEQDTLPFMGTKKDETRFDHKKIKKQISKLKAKGKTAEDYDQQVANNRFLSFIYSKYQAKLRANSLLDFDDCLLSCYNIITLYPVLNYVEHVLVDEFQDTNEIQLQLMYEFARGHPTNPQLQHNLTIVGDPDQSIYGFRDAQSVNFEKMLKYYREKLRLKCSITALNQNYRSTSGILNLCESVMRQQQDRTVKNLLSQHSFTITPTHAEPGSTGNEARWICYQIEHLMRLPNSVFKYSDISVLVRAAYQTRIIEQEFVKRSIPYLMIRGKAFWERKEVVAIIDYLRVVANPNDRIAVLRSLQFPKRGLGDKTIEGISNHMENCMGKGTANDLIKLLKDLTTNSAVKLSSNMTKALSQYTQFIEEARSKLKEVEDNLDQREVLMDKLFIFIYEKSGLLKEFKEDVDRDLNILEVKKQLFEFEPPNDDDLPTFIGGTDDDKYRPTENILQKFIISIGLYDYDDSKQQQQSLSEETKGKVSLSTIHGAKGLEWPVVFVPGLSEGLLPARFAIRGDDEESINEERRCFYVATSRAKLMLFLSSPKEASQWGNSEPIEEVSRFIQKMANKSLLKKDRHDMFNEIALSEVYQMMNIELPRDFDCRKFNNLYKSRMFNYVNQIEEQQESDGNSSFTSARQIKRAPVTSFQSNKKSKGTRKSEVDLMPNKAPAYIPQRKPLGFVPPRIISDSGNKAPSLASKTKEIPTQVISSGATSASKNKAPPYIPVRKAPKYIPQSRR